MASRSSISLRGVDEIEDVEPGSSSAILFKLGENTLQDIRRAAHAKEGLHFMTGNTPKLRIGSRTIDLSLSPDDFRNELFASSSGTSSTDFTFAGVVSHRAELKWAQRKTSEANVGTDAALAALQSSLASYEQEKQAKQVNITNSILPDPRNRFDAARNAKRSPMPGTNNNSRPLSPSLGATGTPRMGAAPTSVPATEHEVKLRAMKTPVIHLLAIGPMRGEEVVKKTHIPKDYLDSILQKFAKQIEGKWLLTDRAYKELEVWKFAYTSKRDRENAVENAIKAYDRMRLGKDEELWQMLLPKEERGKGKVLSRLQLGGNQMNRGLTPHYQPSPIPHGDGQSDSRVNSAANTPRLGPTSTPRPGSSKGDVMKRLLSKDPKRARAAEDAKDKKRKERDAATSDREGGKPAKKQQQATQKATSNVKSEEFVHSSDEESGEEGELNEKSKPESRTSSKTLKETSKTKPKSGSSTSSDSSDAVAKRSQTVEKATAKPKPKPIPESTYSPAVKASKPTTASRSTAQVINTLSAPNTQQKVQRSPSNSNSRPGVPSPLGAARPRVASDVSDKGNLGVQMRKQNGTGTPNGLGITNGAQKRHDTITSMDSNASHSFDRSRFEQTSNHKAATNKPGTPKATIVNGVNHKTDSSLKRKAGDLGSQDREGSSNAKHRNKTESTSSQSLKSHGIPTMATNGTPRMSPDGALDRGSSDSVSSVLESITYNQGVSLAEKFQDIYYPAYAKLYDEQAAVEARGEKVSKEERERLLQMHHRLEQMKREIKAASERAAE